MLARVPWEQPKPTFKPIVAIQGRIFDETLCRR
jgi:hypothetical protein